MISDFTDESYDIEDKEEEKTFLSQIIQNLIDLGVKFHFTEARTLNELSKKLSRYDKNKIVIFNWCEEIYGHPNTNYLVTEFLEKGKYIFSGAHTPCLKISNNKVSVNKVLSKNGIPVPKQYQINDPNISFPVIMKAKLEHGSFGISKNSIVKSKKQLNRFLKLVDKEKFICEQFIDGPEYTVSVWGDGKPQVLPICQVNFESQENQKYKIIDYNSKWDRSDPGYNGIFSTVSNDISAKLRKQINQLTIKTYKVLGCCGFARFEIRIENNIPYFIDFNPNPNFRPNTSFVKAAQHAGYNYGEMVSKLCEFAIDN